MMCVSGSRVSSGGHPKTRPEKHKNPSRRWRRGNRLNQIAGLIYPAGLRAEHVCEQAYGRGGQLPRAHELFSRKAFQSGSGVSFHGTGLRAASFSSALSGPGRHYCRAQRSVRWDSLHSLCFGHGLSRTLNYSALLRDTLDRKPR